MIKQTSFSMDPGIAYRFKQFRKKYIPGSSTVAASILNVSQSYISKLENGKLPVTPELMNQLVKKHNMNSDWLLNGEGDPIVIGRKERSTPMLIHSLKNEIDGLKTHVSIQEKTIARLIKEIERMDKLTQALQTRMDKMDDK